jgi:hypothetical protein
MNRATYKIQMTSYCAEEGESGEDLNSGGGGRGEGVGTWHEPSCGQGGGRRGVEEDAEEKWARGMDLAVVREAVGEMLKWTRWQSVRRSMRHRCGPDGG